MKPRDLIEVTLVDGVGRPFVHSIQRAFISPITIVWPHPELVGGRQVLVKFRRSNNELDAYGRQIYRQDLTGTPPLRDEYLIRQAMRERTS